MPSVRSALPLIWLVRQSTRMLAALAALAIVLALPGTPASEPVGASVAPVSSTDLAVGPAGGNLAPADAAAPPAADGTHSADPAAPHAADGAHSADPAAPHAADSAPADPAPSGSQQPLASVDFRVPGSASAPTTPPRAARHDFARSRRLAPDAQRAPPARH